MLVIVVRFLLLNCSLLLLQLLAMLAAVSWSVSAVLRRREAKPDQPLIEADVRDAALQVAQPIFFATLIIITAYLPLFAFQRVEAKLFLPMAYAIGYAQLGALVFALLVVPGLAYMAYRKPRRVFRNPVLDWLKAQYHGALE